MLRRGELKTSVSFYVDVKKTGKYGKEPSTPELFYKCKAKVSQIASKGRIVDGKEIKEDKFIIKLFAPKSKLLTEKMTIKFKDKTLNITGVLDSFPELHIYASVIS